jgi:hypothetical protein
LILTYFDTVNTKPKNLVTKKEIDAPITPRLRIKYKEHTTENTN